MTTFCSLVLRDSSIRDDTHRGTGAHEPARQVYFDFGKGRHPAGLNLADCFAHARAKATGEPLLFKGEDFAKTDVRAARS